MKKITTLFANTTSFATLFFITSAAMAQPFCNWTKGAGNSKVEEGRSVAIDVNGNVYTTGFYFSPTITFGSITLNNSDNSGGSSDIFIVKQDSCGNVKWAKTAGDAFYDDKGMCIAVDSQGNIYAGGLYGSYTITFGTTTTLINSLGNYDYYITKLNPAGNFLWSKGTDNTSNVSADAITVDGKDCIYLAGAFSSDTLQLDSTHLVNASGGYDDVFLAKFSDSGNMIWAKNYGGKSYDAVNDVVTDNSYNIYLSGSFSDSLWYDATKIYGKGGTDMYIAKCDSAGTLTWLRGFGRTGEDVALGIDVDIQKNIYVTGYSASDSVQFDAQKIINAAFYAGGFFAKLDMNGTGIWVKAISGGIEDYSREVVVDNNDDLIVMGHFLSSTINFGNFTLTNSTNSDTTADIFLAKYDPSGNVLWAKKAGGLRHDFSEDIAVGSNNNPYIVGEFRSSTITFGNNTLVNAGNYDVFVTNQITQNDMPIPDICMVMVDSASTFNYVLWDKTGNKTGVKNYVIYRETATNIYNVLGVVPYDSLSMFKDSVRTKYFPNTGNPNVGSFRYKIQIQDSLGNYSVPSPYHNTIYIVDNGSGTFTWNPLYTIEGASNPVNTYELLRDDNGLGSWIIIGSVAGTQNTISDPLYTNYPNGNWRVQTNWGITCTPTYKTTTVLKSRSNIKDNLIAQGINEKQVNALISVYPNPSHGSLSLEWPEWMNNNVQYVIVKNYLGMQVINVIPEKSRSKMELNISSLAPGIYSIEVKGDKYTAVKKIVVE